MTLQPLFVAPPEHTVECRDSQAQTSHDVEGPVCICPKVLAPGFEWVAGHTAGCLKGTVRDHPHGPSVAEVYKTCTCPHSTMQVSRLWDGVFVLVRGGRGLRIDYQPANMLGPPREFIQEGWMEDMCWFEIRDKPEDQIYWEAWERYEQDNSSGSSAPPSGLYQLVGPGITRAGLVGHKGCAHHIDCCYEPNPHNLERPELRRVDVVQFGFDGGGLDLWKVAQAKMSADLANCPGLLIAPSREALDAGRLDECRGVWSRADGLGACVHTISCQCPTCSPRSLSP